MAKVDVDPKKVGGEDRPAFTLIEDSVQRAEIVLSDFGVRAPWDPDGDNFGWQIEFRLDDDDYKQYAGRRLRYFMTTTPGMPFGERYGQFLNALNLDPGFDDQDVVGRFVAIRIGSYTAKSGRENNSVEDVLALE